MRRRSWFLPPILGMIVALGIGAVSQGFSQQTSIAPAPRFSAQMVLAGLSQPVRRAQLGIDLKGPHAFLAALRLATTKASLVLSPQQLARNPDEPAWDVLLLDHRAAADRRATGNPGICPAIELYLSPDDGRRLIEACSYTVPRPYATLPAPGFGSAGLLHDLRCGCYANGPVPGHFEVSARGYLSSARYGRIADLFPGNPMGKPVQNLRIWSLRFLDPEAKNNGSIGGPGTCARVEIGLRASNGVDFSGACYPSE
jgi:hypothetical protein